MTHKPADPALSDELSSCRVCGLLFVEPPWGSDGKTPSYEFCSCCGVEFGYQDSLPSGAQAFRRKWLADGAHWREPAMKPIEWRLDEQLQNVPTRFK